MVLLAIERSNMANPGNGHGGSYFLHQVSIWYLIYLAQSQKARYNKRLHKFNVAALGLNVFFIGLHIAQTKIWYDGLAQDVPEWTSFAAVAVVLFLILLMETPRRGLALGKKVGLLKGTAQLVRKYHGYYFSWAAIYTFWYHPVERPTATCSASFICS